MDISNPLRVEVRKYRNRHLKVLVFKCEVNDCPNEIRVDAGKHRRFTGKCSSCAAKKRPYGCAFNTLRLTAKHKGHSLSLTYLQYLSFVDKPCHYCGAPIPWVKFTTARDYRQNYFLDRKDNALGYSVENCVACCTECNYTRGARYSYEEFMLLAPGLIAVRSLRAAACRPRSRT